MPTGTTSVAWILAQLDEAAAGFGFPDLGHPYYYAIDARLHGYADDGRWAMVVETVGYNPRGRDVLDVLHTFGNCLTSGKPGFEEEDFRHRIDNFEEVEDDPETWSGSDVVVRGHRLHVDGRPGEDLWEVFRRLVPDHRGLLLADEAELRRRIPHDIPEILRLDAWHQPDVYETKPSESEAYRLVAEALSTRDPGRYRPTEEPNTHWSNWPDSGGL
jgi:hypothetical protein